VESPIGLLNEVLPVLSELGFVVLVNSGDFRHFIITLS